MNFSTPLALLLIASSVPAQPYDLAAIRDASTLETKVLRDWHPAARDQTVRSKLVEITACEWWAGQKVRLPVTFNIPAGAVCSNIVVMNMGLANNPAFPRPDELKLLKDHGVGIVMVGMGTRPRHLRDADQRFYTELAAGRLGLDPKIRVALDERDGRRAGQRVTLAEAKDAGWTPQQIAEMTPLSWNVSRITDYLPALHRRGLEYFYCVGANDSVSPALRELGRQLPKFPLYIVPGGQHGGPATAGFTRRTPLLPEVRENFITFALHHFFGARRLPPAPRLTHKWDPDKMTLTVSAKLPPELRTTASTLWWSVDRAEPFTFFFEYDHWESRPMSGDTAGGFTATVKLADQPERLDILTVHTTVENGLPFTVSSPYRRVLDN